MRVVFIAAECEPWAKTGGLGDVVDALARALGHVPGALDETVEVFLPRYRSIEIPAAATTATFRVPDGPAAGGTTEVDVRSLDADGYRLRLVDHPPAFDRDGFYGDAAGDFPDNARRFALLAATALETRRAEGRPIDVVALHDWHACPAVLLRDFVWAGDPIVGGAAMTLTIHNLAYHGWTPADWVGQLGLGTAAPVDDSGGIDLLRAGIRRVEAVNTVSPTYAREVLEPGMGIGLDGDLRARRDAFGGILNGLDQGLWDPATDAAIAARYSAVDLAGKAACRADLCARIGFDPDDPAPVLGIIGRLDPQKGFDLVAGAAPGLLASGARIVALGTGDPGLVAGMRMFARRSPRRLAMIERFDRDLARRIYAGADLFLMPSRFEPCGQGQMIAMRYGTPPVARRTGGLADTIVDLDQDPAAGTGFLFDDATPAALLAACERALAVRAAAGVSAAGGSAAAASVPAASVPASSAAAASVPASSPWDALVRRAMAVDWAWERSSAPAYVSMYRRAIAARAIAARAAASPPRARP